MENIPCTKSADSSEPINDSLITMLLFWCALLVVSNVYITTPLFTMFIIDFNVTQTMATLTSSIFSLFYAIGFLIFGPLSDRFGRKQIIVSGLCMITIATVFIGFTNDFYVLVILRGIQGLVSASFAPAALAYVFEVFPKEKRVTTIGFISFGFLTAGIFGQVIPGIVAQNFAWNAAFLLFGVLFLCSMIALVFLLPKTSALATNVTIDYFFKQTKHIFLQKNILLCYVITFMLLLTFIGMYTIIGDYLSNPPFYLSETDILLVRSAGLIGMILSPFAGVLVMKYSLLGILRFGLLLSAIGLFMLGFSSSLAIIVFMSICYVAGISLIFPAMMTLIGELSGEFRATAASYYAFILFIGAAIGPVVVITLLHTGSYFITFTVLAILLLIGYAATLLITQLSQAEE